MSRVNLEEMRKDASGQKWWGGETVNAMELESRREMYIGRSRRD